jgi:chromosome segregation ATPase
MGKFFKTVFGGNGIVSNLVDIATVPDMIKKKKSEIEHLETQLATVETKYASLKEQEKVINNKQVEINNVKKTMKINKDLIKQLLDSETQNTQLLQLTAQNMNSQQNNLNRLIHVIASCRKTFDTQQQSYLLEKREITAKLDGLRVELNTLESKLERKRGQLNNNFNTL